MVGDFGDSYTGPPLYGNEENGRRLWVPIYPNNSEWYTSRSTQNRNTETVTECNDRKIFPLCIFYVWTIWKVQGQTMCTEVISSLGVTEKEHGIKYIVFHNGGKHQILVYSMGFHVLDS